MGAVALGPRRIPRVLAAAAVAGLAAILNPWIFDGLYERMVQKSAYNPSSRFLHVVENRSGVITVYRDRHGLRAIARKMKYRLCDRASREQPPDECAAAEISAEARTCASA